MVVNKTFEHWFLWSSPTCFISLKQLDNKNNGVSRLLSVANSCQPVKIFASFSIIIKLKILVKEYSRNALPHLYQFVWQRVHMKHVKLVVRKMHYFWSTTTCKVRWLNFLISCFQRGFPSTIHTSSCVWWKDKNLLPTNVK